MSNPKKSDSGCFAGVLRRFLCQGSLQTHPSDQPELYEQKEELKPEAKIQSPGAPGIVAKLMGIESLPESNWVPKGKTPDSVTRSRSVNFMDYLLEFNAAQAQQHRRVRTSVSFREVSTPLHQQNDDLFVLYLDEVEEKKKGSNLRKSAVDLGDIKQKKEEKSKSKKENTRERLVMKKKENPGNGKKVAKFIDEPRRAPAKQYSKINNCKGAKDLGVVLPGKKQGNRKTGAIRQKKIPVKSGHQKEVSVKGSVNKKSKHLLVIEEFKPAEAECNSENSSPVSVLDINDFSIYDETPLSEEWSSLDLNSKWKSTLKTMNCDYPSAHFTQISSKNNDLELRVMKKNNYESMDNIQYIDYYIEIVAKLHKFTEAEIMQSYWMPEKVLNFEDLEEMCMEFGQHILDVLLQQVIDELVGFNMESCVM